MSASEFAQLARFLAWPLTTIGVLAAFYRPLCMLLDRLAQTLTVRTVKVKVFGVELELTPEQAKEAVGELLTEITDSTNDLSAEESDLFERILASGGRDRLDQILPNFKRDTLTLELQPLRKLRDRKLVRPFEGGKWESDKHPVVTRFGQLVNAISNRKQKIDQ
jgi:hypothetical protein